MTLSQSALSSLHDALRVGDTTVDLVAESVRIVLQQLIDAESTAAIGAGRYERSTTRVAERNGTRAKTITTKGGDVQVAIPKLRQGSFFPSILEPRRRIDHALHAVVMEAYVHGVSTRSVDDLVQALGGAGISKSEVSRICQGLDEQVAVFKDRRLDHVEFPYVYLDATYLHVRTEQQLVVSKAVVIATGITATGRREVLGVDVGDSEDELFWRDFLTSLKGRGLAGVKLVASDQHAGLVAAINRCFQGVAHQRCRVHFVRNLLSYVPRHETQMVAAIFRTIFAQPNKNLVLAQWDKVRDELAVRYPKAAALMDGAKAEVVAFAAFPREHWVKIWSTNPLERLDKEIKRRSRVVGIFPNDNAIIRLIGAVLADTHDEWQVDEKRYLSERSMDKLYKPDNTELVSIEGDR